MKRAHAIASLGPIGYLPVSGTFATLITIPVVYLLAEYIAPIAYALIVCLITVVALASIHEVLKQSTDPDPSHIVIDEVVGCFYTFLFLPVNGKTLIIGFLLFRFFDITKWCGIKYCEKLPGAWGVLADDCAAGLLSNVVLQWMLHYGVI
jgi:phosphatidylglycerophosphatase A